MMMGEFTNLNQRLGSIKMEIPAQALVVLRKKQLLAHAGNLPFNGVEELVGLINSMSRFFSNNIQKQLPSGLHRSGYGDLVRFIQLQSTQEKYLLYAVYLARDIMLASLFSPHIPFNQVRKQTLQIARELQSSPSSSSLEFRTTEALGSRQHTELQNEHDLSQVKSSVADTQPSYVSSIPTTIPPYPEDEEAIYPRKESSIPGIGEFSSGFSPNRDVETGAVDGNTPSQVEGEVDQIAYHESAELAEPASGGVRFVPSQGNLTPDQNSPILEDETTTTPSIFGHYITYSCLLIPRMPQHLLSSNLASYLFKWMGQLCLAYGWRLEHLSIHSNHVQWIAGAPLTTSPAYLVRTLRQKTSRYIFTQFPPLSNDNPSGDFWAPGFFITGGKQSIQAHLVEKYVNQIREHQGANNPDIYQ